MRFKSEVTITWLTVSMRRKSVIFFLLTLLLPLHGLTLGAEPAFVASEFGNLVSTDVAKGKSAICALRDAYGFLWVGTPAGLACYDGNGRPVYAGYADVHPATEGMPVTAIFENGDDIWFGGTAGVQVFKRSDNSVSPLTAETQLGAKVSSPVRRIMDAGEGFIWILTLGQGAFVYNTSDHTLVQNSSQGAYYTDMTVGRDGRVYLVSLDGDLQIFGPAGGFITAFHLPEYVRDKQGLRIARSKGDIRIASRSGIYHFDPATQDVHLESPFPARQSVNAVLGDLHGNLIMATDSGMHIYDVAHGVISQPLTDGSRTAASLLSSGKISHISYDVDSSLIIVTPGAGINHLMRAGSDFRKVPLPGGSEGVVTAMAIPADGRNVWLGTDNGIAVFNPVAGTVRDLPALKALVSSIVQQGDTLWVATRNTGLYRLQLNSLKLYHYNAADSGAYAIVNNDISQVYASERGELFVLTSTGLCRYVAASDDFVTLQEPRPGTLCNVMQEDRAGRLWVATAEGFYRRDTPSAPFRPFVSESVGRRPVTIMYLDRAGVLWSATDDGHLYCFDEKTGDFLPVELSMTGERRIDFLEDDLDGNLWVGTPGGLARIDRRRSVSYFSYRTGEGVLPSLNAVCRLSDGRIAFGGQRGLWLFNPAEMTADNRYVKTYVQSLSLPAAEDSDGELERLGLNVPLYTRKEIRLPYSDNTFTLGLSAARGADMPSVRYDYMLEGVDKHWVRGASDEVTYTDLRPGKYTFLLRPAFGSDNDMNRLVIVILPPWYRTWMAYTVYVIVALVLMVFAVVLLRRRLQTQYQNRIEAVRVQKEHETFEAKMRFFVNLVHEIRTPLTLISIPLEQMAADVENGVPDAGANRKHIASMRRNVNYLLGITNQLLDFRKAEEGKEVELLLRDYDLKGKLADICGRFEHPMRAIGKNITLVMPQGDVSARIDLDKTDRVIMNLIGNAVKYSRSSVDVTLREPVGGNVSITVADDGPGIDPAERERIFDTYYQIGGDNVAANLGTGLGLAYAKLIATAHGGDIKVENNPSGGATFTLTLPVGGTATGEAAQGSVTEAVPSAAVGSASSDVTVLLVDDNRELLTTVADGLGKNYAVVTATSGEEALAELNRRPDVDVIVSDFMMPGMSGGELCRAVKSDERFSHVPFIILTAKTDSDAKVEGMECGADVYMEKPFSIKQLNLQIANILHTRELFHARMTASRAVDAPAVMSSDDEEPSMNRLDAEFIATLNAYISENVSEEDFSIDVMAKQMNMSRSSFYRKLKAVTGLTPVDYLKNYRLEYAARLLLDGVRVTEVAVFAGFTSSSYFAKCFRARFGMIPKEYVAAHSPKTG